jgi:predicted molibdopterin-dependent oxidoreductase YjgC
MFRRLPDLAEKVIPFTLDGRALTGHEGDSVAAAMLANGVGRFRNTPVSHAPRSAYCLMGVCFDCLVTIDGVGNRQACMTPLQANMAVETQDGARPVNNEVTK